MSSAPLRWCVIGLMAAILAASAAIGDGVIAVKAGRIITMAGQPIEGGAILIADGKIRKIGPQIAIPKDATVIDVPDSVVMPGIVDANARYGLRGDANEQSSEITPMFSPLGAIDHRSRELQRALQLGVTTARIAPGNANVIAGRGVVIKSSGERLDDWLVCEGDEVTITLGNDAAFGNRIPRSGRPTSFYYRQPTTRMGIVWMLRKALADVQSALEAGEELDEGQQVLHRALKGGVPVHVTLQTAVDVETVFTIADEFGLQNLVLVQCTEGYKAAKEIAQRNVPVILGPFYTYPRDGRESYYGGEVSWNCAGLLAQAGVKVAVASNEWRGPADLLLWATMARRNGLSEEDALRAITTHPAEIIGVAHRVGSLTKGKDADLLILSGEPLDLRTRIEKVIVNGRIAFEAGSDANDDG